MFKLIVMLFVFNCTCYLLFAVLLVCGQANKQQSQIINNKQTTNTNNKQQTMLIVRKQTTNTNNILFLCFFPLSADTLTSHMFVVFRCMTVPLHKRQVHRSLPHNTGTISNKPINEKQSKQKHHIKINQSQIRTTNNQRITNTTTTNNQQPTSK